MAIVNTKSTAITNSDATPKVINSGYLQHGRVRENVGTLEAVSADSIGSVYRLVRIWSGVRVSAIQLLFDAITTCAGDVGLYDISDDGGAVVDADFFASAVDLSGAQLVPLDVTYEAGILGIDDIEKPLWEALGLTSDPRKHYDVAITLTAAAGSAGTVCAKAIYVDGS